MSNVHALPDTLHELMCTWGDLGPQVIVAHSGLTVPASSLTLPAVSATGYVLVPGPPARLVYVSQPAVSLTVSGGNGTYWVALHADLSSAVAGWTRRAGSHLLWQMAATPPATPAGGLVFCQVTVAGGVISAVTPVTAVTSGPMSRQNSNSVGITGGTAFFTGTLSANADFFVTGTSQLAGHVGIGVAPPASPAALVVAGDTLVTGNLSSNADVFGTHGQFGGRVGIGQAVPSAPTSLAVAGGGLIAGDLSTSSNLFVTGQSQLAGAVGIGVAPDPARALKTNGQIEAGTDLLAGQSLNIGVDAFIARHIQVTGEAYKTVAGPWNAISDRRVKTAIGPLVGALATLLALQGRTFEYVSEPQRTRCPGPQAGLIADEVAAVRPQWVGQYPGTDLQTVGPVGFEAYVIEALREVVQRLEALERRAGVSAHTA